VLRAFRTSDGHVAEEEITYTEEKT